MKTLFVLNARPHGTERSDNALRLAQALPGADPAAEVTILLMADAATVAR